MNSNRRGTLILAFLILCSLGLNCECNPESSDEEPGVWLNLFWPDHGEVVQSQEILFRWGAPHGTGDIWIEEFDSVIFGIRNDFISTFTEAQVPYAHPEMSYLIDTLAPAATYHWNVYASGYTSDSIRYSYLSPTRTFRTADRLLRAGELYNPTPDSAAFNVGLEPILSCELYNPDSISFEYDLYFGQSVAPSLLASKLNGLTYNFTGQGLEYATTYHWRFEAYAGEDTLSSPLWTFTTEYSPTVNVFAAVEIDALQAPSGYHVMEEIRARIDTGVAVTAPVMPLQADSVLVANTRLFWQPDDLSYSYTEMSMPFIGNGSSVSILIYGNDQVPNLNTSITFPACTLSIVSPESFESVPISGFEVTWNGADCGGEVILALLDGADSTGVWKIVPNDGIDSLTATDLQALGGQTGVYDLYVLKQVEEKIVAPGYKSQSFVRTRVINRMLQIILSSN